ncbi:MAG: metallophosphoesterase [Polyangiales bacterium]
MARPIARAVTTLLTLGAFAMQAPSAVGLVSCARREAVDEAHASTTPNEVNAGIEAREDDRDRTEISFEITLPAAPPDDARSMLDRCRGEAMPIRPTPARATCNADKPATRERVTLLHVSDMHAHWQPLPHARGARSPLAILRAYVDRRRRETSGRALFFDAGDDLEKGSVADLMSNGDATLHLLDRVGLDARTLGNHDFAYGIDSVLRQGAASYPLLASNLRFLGEPGETRAFGGKRTAVIEIGCVRVGVFGLTIDAYDERDERSDAPYLGAFAQTHDVGDHDRYVDTARALVRELRDEQHVDAVVAIDHLGAALDRALIDEVPGLDVVISGHDHRPIYGHWQGRHGVMVDSGSFLGGEHDMRVGEVTLEIDREHHSSSLVGTTAHRLDALDDHDAAMESEVRRVLACVAPKADERLTDTIGALSAGRPDTWVPVLDAAITRHFPTRDAILYEAFEYGGPMKEEILPGPVTTQKLIDLAYVEKQRAGGPGFTAFVGVEVQPLVLRSICESVVHAEPGRAIHRVCPSRDAYARAEAEHRSMRLVIERRPLYFPDGVFWTVPDRFPTFEAIATTPIETYELLVDHARALGKQCKALDRDVAVSCPTAARPGPSM